MTERCETCRFWKRTEDKTAIEEGQCRRSPPVLNTAAIAEEEDRIDAATSQWPWFWPATLEHDWCGEWAPDSPPPPPLG